MFPLWTGRVAAPRGAACRGGGGGAGAGLRGCGAGRRASGRRASARTRDVQLTTLPRSAVVNIFRRKLVFLSSTEQRSNFHSNGFEKKAFWYSWQLLAYLNSLPPRSVDPAGSS